MNCGRLHNLVELQGRFCPLSLLNVLNGVHLLIRVQFLHLNIVVNSFFLIYN